MKHNHTLTILMKQCMSTIDYLKNKEKRQNYILHFMCLVLKMQQSIRQSSIPAGLKPLKSRLDDKKL